MFSQSEALFKRAEKVIPGGVNSPVRAFKGVLGEPVFINHADGAYLYDEDENKYIDYIGSWGPLILGHNHPAVIDAVVKQAEKGLGYGTTTQLEVELAEKLCKLLPSMDMVRLVSSGTEATMSAIRLARGHVKRNKIIKFEGCYHGHSDALLVNAGSGALTLNKPSSDGVPDDFVKHTLTAQYNDLDSVAQLFEQHPEDIAAIIIEPVPGNMNLMPPTETFLPGLRALCDKYGSLLIFDEVMSGFRVALGGAQALYDVEPDITTLGKVIGAGLPVGAFGGKKAIMENLAPLGGVYQAGTLSGNPLAVSAGLAALTVLEQPGFFEKIAAQTSKLVAGINELAENSPVDVSARALGTMFGIYFSKEKNITRFEQIKSSNLEQFKHFHHTALQKGIYFAPSMFEAGFVSVAHDDAVVAETLAIVEDTLKAIQ